jgi:putative oxidoreductase
MNFFAQWEPQLRSLLRIVFGLNFFLHGLQKAFGLLGGPRFEITTQLGAAGAIETVLGALILAGLFTRPAAFVACGQMAVAYFMVHAGMGLWPVVNGGEPAVLYCFAFLWLAAAGAGPWSIDALRSTPGSRRANM